MEKDHSDKNQVYDVVIIGGGLAGLSSAIHLSKYDFSILLIEQHKYPKHKVCGEYISNEVLPYLKFLGFDPFAVGAKKISKFELSTPNSKQISCTLPLGGFGISRHKIDSSLAKIALQGGVEIIYDQVIDINYKNEQFVISTKSKRSSTSKVVIGAYGKRSPLDIKLQRSFIRKRSPYLAVKIHAKGNFPADSVALHNFKGGYCGVSKVENDSINLCYITEYNVFKKYKNIEDFQRMVIFKNKYLKQIFTHSNSVFEKPLTISQISFSTKSPIEQHMIMCGDTAGMIHPLCGNGMSMAIRSAQIASKLVIKFLKKEITRDALEKSYIYRWEKEFKQRLMFGHFVASLFRRIGFIELLMPLLKLFPGLLPKIIQYSHGKPMSA